MALLIVVAGLFLRRHVSAAEPVIRLLKSDGAGTSLLRNGGFEQLSEGKLADWSPAPNGFSIDAGQGRNGSKALRAVNLEPGHWSGASQTLTLNRTNPAPLVVHGWSKSENVSGSADSGYSLYVDILYNDGTPLWGQTANFRTGTHDWQERQLVILPQKAIKSLTLHCILRGHSGTAWFDDVSLEEIGGGTGVVFEGLAAGSLPEIRNPPAARGKIRTLEAQTQPASERVARAFKTKDGLALSLRGGQVSSLRLGGREVAAAAPSGFLVRDVAANSDFYAFQDGQCRELGLSVRAEYEPSTNHIGVRGRVSDTTGKDRAITLLYALPIDATGWRWGEDIRRNRTIRGRTEIANCVGIGCGATGTMSLYPLAALYGEAGGLGLGLDMRYPAQFRLVYHPATKQFYVAYDFGLVPETERFPSAAEFRFVLFHFDPQWGFRAAFQKYTEIFPEDFRLRTAEQGLWMPFTDVSTVQNWQDFGFRYHEGNNNVSWDDAHGIQSFRYTEPMTWWMTMERALPRTFSEAMRVRDQLAAGSSSAAPMARVSQVAAMDDETGEPALSFRDTPWCNGAVWSINPNPYMPIGAGASMAAVSDQGQYNGATVYWNHATKERLYGPGAKGELDGEYLDSIEGYVTTDLNYRREHFRYTSVPVCFDAETKRPALFKGLAVYEFTRWMAEDVHALGKLMFANGVPYRFSFLCPWLDVLGTETDWLDKGHYRPASDPQMALWRTMAGRKPYLLLMNTDYDAFTPPLVEQYFQRSLFYGVFPSMFSHNASEHPYWQEPRWYNRDRALFKKYIPLIKRIAEAGWQPVTRAKCDNEQIYVERFGPEREGILYLTFLNDTAAPQSGRLDFEGRALGIEKTATARDLLSGAEQAISSLLINLAPQQATVIAVKTPHPTAPGGQKLR